MSTIGIFGGGQVAKMIAQAASTLSVEVIVFAQYEDEPALQVIPKSIIGQWDDETLLRQFAEQCDVITLENATVPVEILRRVEQLGTKVYPTSATLEQVQDKLIQKRHMQQNGIAVPRFKQVLAGSDVLEASTEYGFPLMLKIRKPEAGIPQASIIRRAHDIEPALQRFQGRELMAEEITKFVRELAVIVARDADGDIRAYPVV
ncbi:MAG: ATP-grasp domain-containing protein, partial [Anaerolineae bacterium]|nr:ATP-grasp domain-containing protein [Anaerolineae bacterium]